MKKKQIKDYLKTGILLLGILAITTNCEKEIIIETPNVESQSVGTRIENISSNEAPQIINAITSLTGNTALKSTLYSKTLKYKKARINLDRILKIKNKKNIANYTFNILIQDSPINEFYNLIVNEDASKKIKEPYVIKYVVDDDALDNFLANNNDFSYFKGKTYILPFNSFFESFDLQSKSSTSDPCPPIETNIDLTASNVAGGNGGSGGIRDIPIDNLLQTDPYGYDFTSGTTGGAGSSFSIYFNSDNTTTLEPSSFGNEEVRNPVVSFNVSSAPGTVIQVDTSTPSLAPNLVGLVIVTCSPASSSGSGGGSVSTTRHYSDGTFTVHWTYFYIPQAEQKQEVNAKAPPTTDPCPLPEGEIGVYTIPAAAEVITDCLGLDNLSNDQRLFVLKDERSIDVANYLYGNCNNESKKFAKEAIDIHIGLNDFDKLIKSPDFDPLNNPWLKALREYAKRLEQLKDKISESLWDGLNQYLDDQLVKALNKTAFELYEKADTTKESNKQYEFETNGKNAVAILLYEFANGEGPDEREFPFNFNITQQMLAGNVANDIKSDFNNELLEENLTLEQFVANGEPLTSSYTFSPDHTGVTDSFNKHINANWVQFFVGGTSTTYYPSDEQGWIIVKMRNPTSRHSLLLHIGADYDREDYGNIPLSTIEQVFKFKLKVN